MDIPYQFKKVRLLLTGYRFVAEGMTMGRVPELTGGGLIRSKGGWSQVVSARRRGEREEFDERILGGGDFVSAILWDCHWQRSLDRWE